MHSHFRRSVADCCTKPYHDDHYLLRWLRALCSVSFLPRKETVCLARNFNPEAAEKMLRESVAILANSGRRDLNSRTSRKTQPRSLTFGTKLLSPGMATFIYNKALAGWAGFFFAPTRMPERQ
uniref:Uncharacterized protein n=1 Tax=Timema tahoe TaxID=61484 RepID=A0A7R9FJD0_9NEOP|nr:unnamed protein product [Timema tahoe]